MASITTGEAAAPPLSIRASVDLDGTRPLTDPKHYRYIQLSNGLDVLLISDPRVSSSAGAGVNGNAAEEDDEGDDSEEDDDEDEEGMSVDEDDDEGDSGSSCSDDEEGEGSSCDMDDEEEGAKNGHNPSSASKKGAVLSHLDSLDSSMGGPHDSHEVESPKRHHHHHHHQHPHVGHDQEEVVVCIPEPEASTAPLTGNTSGGGGGDDAAGVRLAAASMCVGVGSFSDPESVQGLAHYLEHMLFMGSKKYPSENEYDSFISQRGGYSNAMTECEYTVYHFEIPPAHFGQALDIFAQFFISPLMRPEASARELQSIESEFNLSRGSDNSRLTQLICHTCLPGHPYAKFAWGNLESLREEPVRRKVDVNEELRTFHDQYYVASNMKLVVLGMEDLDSLQNMVMQTFSGIAGGDASPPPSTSLSTLPPPACFLPLDAEHSLGWIYRMIPVKDIHQLHLNWQLPTQLAHYRSKPWECMGHLLGHEDKGSILAELKELGWATGIVAGISSSGYDSSTGAAFFAVTVHLTVQGVENWSSIILLIFQYLDLVKQQGWQSWIFEELKAIAQMQYTYQEEVESGDLVEHLATSMLPMYQYQPQEFLQAPFLIWEWRPDLLDEMLTCMTPGNGRIDLLSSLFGRAGDVEASEGNSSSNPPPPPPSPSSSTTLPPASTSTPDLSIITLQGQLPIVKEPRFGVYFTRERLSAQVLQEWAGPRSSLHPRLSFPHPNPFIATDLSVKDLPPPSSTCSSSPSSVASLEGPEVEAALTYIATTYPDLTGVVEGIRHSPAIYLPTLLIEQSGFKLWHLQDRVFRMPRSAIFLKLATPLAYTSPRHEVLTELLVRLVKDSLNETTYQASIAELNYSLKATELGLELHFHGLSHRLLTLVDLVLQRLLDFVPHLREVRFETQKESLLRTYANENLKPSRYARNIRLGILKEKMWNADDLHQQASLLTLPDLLAFIAQLMTRFHVDCLMQGNCTTEDAHLLTQKIQSSLQKAHINPLPPQDYPTNRVICLPMETNLIYAIDSKDSGERNSALEAYWQFTEDHVENRVVVQMLEQVMDEPLYDTLRTKEQLGYSVSCGLRNTNGVLGLAIRIQSERYEPTYLHRRVEEFLMKKLTEKLHHMSDKEFYRQLTALISNKLQRDASLNDEAGRYWAEINDRRYQFDVIQQEVKGLLQLSKSKLLALFDSAVNVTANQARHLCVQVTGQACKARRSGGTNAPSPPPKSATGTKQPMNGEGPCPSALQQAATTVAGTGPLSPSQRHHCSSPPRHQSPPHHHSPRRAVTRKMDQISSSPSKRPTTSISPSRPGSTTITTTTSNNATTPTSSPARKHHHHHHHHPPTLPSSKVRKTNKLEGTPSVDLLLSGGEGGGGEEKPQFYKNLT